ncbi:MAG: Phage integrase family protein [Planctomycetaceae bacterium]|nr:Phage integrase family protein [Planctomycetaceae bacterium]
MTAKNKTDRQTLKPYPDYPLTAHKMGRWCKKIKGILYYFGPLDDPDAALEKYLKHRDNLQAGLGWLSDEVVLTVVELFNQYLEAKDAQVQRGELSPVTFADYRRICTNAAEIIGKTKPVKSLGPPDFERLRNKLAETRNSTTLKTELQKIKTVFHYAYDNELIDTPFRLKVLLKTPSKKTIRAERNEREPQMMEPPELRTILSSATIQMRGMVLLGLNCAFGASDISSLPESAVNLKTGWIDFPRPKTGIPRRCPLWPETIDALRAVLAKRPAVKDPAATGKLFVTRHGSTYVGMSPAGKYIDSIGLTFGKLLRKLEMKRDGVNFYTLRRIFETVAGSSEAQIPVDHIMGHSPDSDDMSSIYRQQISDPRLQSVVNHVRLWLWSEGSEVAWLAAEEIRRETEAAKPKAKSAKPKAAK